MIVLILLALGCTDTTTTADSAATDPPTDSAATAQPVAADCPTPAGTPTVSDSWESLPMAPAGDISGFAITPADADRIYVVSSINGPFRSVDGGHSWQGLDPVVTHVLSQPLAGQQDPDLFFQSVGELYRSRDAGDTWEATGLGDRYDVQQYIKGMVWSDGALLAVEASGQVHESVDGGETFAAVGVIGGPRHQDYYVLDDSYWRLVASDDGVLLAARHGTGVWRSVDGGQTWEDKTGYRQVQVASLGIRGELAFYADSDGFYVSRDAGQAFERIQTETELIVAATPSQDTVLAFTGGSVWRLEDEALVPWSVPELGTGAALSAQTLADGTVLLGHEQGILRSTDGGATWADSGEGLVDDDLAVVLAHSQCQDFLFVGTQCESGGFTTTDGGDTLDHAPTYMHYVMVAKEDPHDANALWVTSDDRVHRTRDLGGSWEIAVPDSLAVHFHGLDIDPWNRGTVLIGSVGSGSFADGRPRVYRTDDDGYRWQDSSAGLPDGDWSVHALHYSLAVPDVVLMGSFRGGDIAHNGPPGVGMFRSTDGGRSWTAISLDGIEDVAGFAECAGRIHAATTDGVLYSDDAGASWTPGWQGTAQTLAVACQGEVVLALDQQSGLVRSDDAGVSWASWDEDRPEFQTSRDQYLSGVAISPDGQTAWAAIRSRGLWRRAL